MTSTTDSPNFVSAKQCLIVLGIEPTATNIEQMTIFIEAMLLYTERNARYSDVWRATGWRGAVYDIYKKARRLFQQFWDPETQAPTGERNVIHGKVTDDAFDLINFAAFFIRGVDEQNEWGTP